MPGKRKPNDEEPSKLRIAQKNEKPQPKKTGKKRKLEEGIPVEDTVINTALNQASKSNKIIRPKEIVTKTNLVGQGTTKDNQEPSGVIAPTVADGNSNLLNVSSVDSAAPTADARKVAKHLTKEVIVDKITELLATQSGKKSLSFKNTKANVGRLYDAVVKECSSKDINEWRNCFFGSVKSVEGLREKLEKLGGEFASNSNKGRSVYNLMNNKCLKGLFCNLLIKLAAAKQPKGTVLSQKELEDKLGTEILKRAKTGENGLDATWERVIVIGSKSSKLAEKFPSAGYEDDVSKYNTVVLLDSNQNNDVNDSILCKRLFELSSTKVSPTSLEQQILENLNEATERFNVHDKEREKARAQIVSYETQLIEIQKSKRRDYWIGKNITLMTSAGLELSLVDDFLSLGDLIEPMSLEDLQQFYDSL